LWCCERYEGGGIEARNGAKVMIKDMQGRKWFMRFKRYRQGWRWEARHGNHGQSSGMRFFQTKAHAETDARRQLQGRDAIAAAAEYLRRVTNNHRPDDEAR
jgi:hypothetical protein